MANAHSIHATTVGHRRVRAGPAGAVIAMMLAIPLSFGTSGFCALAISVARSRVEVGVSSNPATFPHSRTAMEAGEAPVQSLSAGKRRRTPPD
jgi:hypothetical protein